MCPVGRTLVSPVFVGREAELAALTAALDAAVAGDPAVVLLSGEAGVGKTRLVEEAAERANAAGVRVLAGSCIEMGGEGLPFGPLAHALRSLVRDTSPEELDAIIGPARSELAQVLPGLDPDSALGAAPLGEGGTARLLELVVGVIERLAADRPLMFVIEDLHWADRSTLDLVALLVRAMRADRVLVVISFRSDELHRSHPLRPLVTGWERVRPVQRIELGRLGRADVARQLEAILGAPPTGRLVDQVHERSEGNAFLVEEILGAIQSGADPDQLPLSHATSCSRASSASTHPPSGCCASRRPRAARCPTGCSPRSPASRRPSSTRRCARPSSTTCSWSTTPSAATRSAMR
jgi:predicted ATPase